MNFMTWLFHSVMSWKSVKLMFLSLQNLSQLINILRWLVAKFVHLKLFFFDLYWIFDVFLTAVTLYHIKINYLCISFSYPKRLIFCYNIKAVTFSSQFLWWSREVFDQFTKWLQYNMQFIKWRVNVIWRNTWKCL